MAAHTLLFKILLSLGLGGLIGIDRERVHKGYPGGIRTLALLSLLGTLTSFISDVLSNFWIVPCAVAMVFLLVGVGYSMSIKKGKSFGLTSTVVILLTYVIGLITYFDDYQYIAISVSIIITLVLIEKRVLHKFARKVKQNELLDALKFGIVAFVILPLLPNKTIDPWGVINPYNLWLMVVLILGISFIGYISSKLFGAKKGIYSSALLGGLISSTLVSSSLSILSKKNEDLCNACAAGITLASSIMFVRVFIEAYVVNNELGVILLPPLLITCLIGLIITYFTWKSTDLSIKKSVIEKSPFNFLPALKFTLLLAMILITSEVTYELIGSSGAYITSVLGGLMDTDAVTVSMASLSGASLSYKLGRNAVIIACLTNSVVKLLIVKSSGDSRLFKKVLLNYSIMLIPLIIFILLTF